MLKDDKLQSEQLNDPVNDCKKAEALFYDEVNAFLALPPRVKQIFCCLLYSHPEFQGFFHYVKCRPQPTDLPALLRTGYKGCICVNADLQLLIRNHPVELAYVLALIGTNDTYSLTPPWLLRNYPGIAKAETG